MSQLPSMPMWWADFFSKTDHLSNEEQWAYAKLLAKTWLRNGRPFPDEPRDLARLLNMGVKRWLKIRDRLAPFFDLSRGTWRQQRLENEFLEVTRRREISRSNGSLGGRPLLVLNNGIRNPAGSFQDNLDETTHTHSHTYKKESPSVSPPGRKPKRKAPAHAIVEAWQPDDRDRDYARSKGHDDQWIEEQAEFFRDHHLKHGKLFCDWNACWRTWVQNWAKFNSNGKVASNGHDRSRVPLDSTPSKDEIESARRRIYANLGIAD